jgi:predicted exporter
MLSREDVIRCMSNSDRRWIARCQMVAVVLFLALLAGVVLWPVLAP